MTRPKLSGAQLKQIARGVGNSRRVRPSGAAVGALIWLAGCSSDATLAGPSTATGGGAAARNAEGSAGTVQEPDKPGDQPDGGSAAPISEFAALYDSTFKKYCVGCHGGGTAGLNMSSLDATYRALVDVPANPNGMCGKTNLKRVEPGDPEKSLLYLKLKTAAAPCGQQMPVGGELNPELQAAIKRWIEEGAHN